MTQVKFNGRPALQYDRFFNDFFDLPSWKATAATSAPANIYETPGSYFIEFNVPGRNKEDFKVKVDKDLLTVSFEKKEEKEQTEKKYISREFCFNSFTRTFSLDKKIEVANIQARYDNGILKVELPKKEELKAEPKQIDIL